MISWTPADVSGGRAGPPGASGSATVDPSAGAADWASLEAIAAAEAGLRPRLFGGGPDVRMRFVPPSTAGSSFPSSSSRFRFTIGLAITARGSSGRGGIYPSSGTGCPAAS